MIRTLVAIAALGALLSACGRGTPPPAQPAATAAATFVGAPACASCHAAATAEWATSDHHEAMQVANASTVKGDFAGGRATYYGIESRFTTEGNRYRVRTDGADGKLADFDVKYVFGHRPLQQYLIAAPGGRMQALSLSWDTRPKAVGGQRWFHLYPDDKVDSTDVLHWTAPSQNWNYTCAECHSTNLQKNYQPATKTFDTRWSEINVSCESCHGPGSRHVTWAALPAASRPGDPTMGLVFSMRDTSKGTWAFAPRRADRQADHGDFVARGSGDLRALPLAPRPELA